MTLTPEAVTDALRGVMDPELHHNIVELGLVRDVQVDDGTVYVEIELTNPRCPFADHIVASIKQAVGVVAERRSVEVEWSCRGGP
jgi:ATP-binding protein involved in chromosome partitioning